MNSTRTGNSRRLLVLLILLSGLACAPVYAVEPVQRAQDLAYGRILYAYHQGQAFEALSLMSAAELNGGIKGHGEHPKLVEGGMMLSYGMVEAAKAQFESVLKEQLSVDDRNIAWFYLGKVFYLQQNTEQAINSFKKINTTALKSAEPEKFYELLYLKGQMASALGTSEGMQWQTDLPAEHIFRFYLRYNQALALIDEQKQEKAIEALNNLSEDLKQRLLFEEKGQLDQHQNEPEYGPAAISARAELRALLDQSLLSLAQLQLQSEQAETALSNLKNIDKEGAFAAEALFLYALAASQLQRYELALSALTELKERKHFNAWKQQSPYALAYLYEQMAESSLALQAYRAAVGHYESIQQQLGEEREAMNEDLLLSGLGLKNSIGQSSLVKDAYGRVQTDASAFNFATLLATEEFQKQLSELHELYVLHNSLATWKNQLDSFDVMLETRQLARREKLQALQTELNDKDASTWQQKTSHYQTLIDQALAEEDPYFFMSEEQLAYYQRIQKTRMRLRELPDSHPDKASYQQRLKRVQDYFAWWIADDYAVNRWRTVKQQKQLQQEMSLFQKKYDVLKSQQTTDDAHLEFSARLAEGRQRLAVLQKEIDSALQRSRRQLLTSVDQAMQQQLDEITAYMIASREALARVSDQLLSQAPALEAEDKSQAEGSETP